MANFMILAFGAVAAAGVTLPLIGTPNSRIPPAAPLASSPTPATSAAPQPDPAAAATNATPAPQSAAGVGAAAQTAWMIPDIDKLPNDDWARTVRYGRDLVAKTYALIGPEVTDKAHRFAGNNLSCQSCHLEAGTKQFGLLFRGVYADFLNYRARSGAVGTIEDRIQGCMTRSLSGKPLPPDSKEMTALVAYMKFLSDDRPVGTPTLGRGAGHMPELTRAADPLKGKEVYARNCAMCHGPNGQGQRSGKSGDAQGYTFPPLWGDDRFNDGAGMDRLIGAANFIHSNMPNGTTWQAPVLSDEDAWDVAAYVAVAASEGEPRARLSRRPAEACGYRVWPVCRRVQPETAQTRSLCPDPRKGQRTQGEQAGTTSHAIVVLCPT